MIEHENVHILAEDAAFGPFFKARTSDDNIIQFGIHFLKLLAEDFKSSIVYLTDGVSGNFGEDITTEVQFFYIDSSNNQ